MRNFDKYGKYNKKMLLFQAFFRQSLWLDFKWLPTHTHALELEQSNPLIVAVNAFPPLPRPRPRLRLPCAIPAPSTTINVCAMINMPNSWQYLPAGTERRKGGAGQWRAEGAAAKCINK